MIYSFMFVLLLSCNTNNWEIEICSQINGKDCENSNNVFNKNVKLFVTLESKSLITEKLIIGSIYRMGEDGTYKDYLGTKNFVIEPNTFKIKHFIPFDELGGTGPHLIEFTAEDGTLILSKELLIK